MVGIYLQCMAMVAAFHHFPPHVLPSIYQVEGGKAGSVHQNSNGTQDLGIMQVNTRWVMPLMRATGASGQEVYTRLRDDTCYNIAAAGAILDQYRQEAKGNMLQAIGYYHSHTPMLKTIYQLKVIMAAEGRPQPYSSSATATAGKIGKKSSPVHLSPYQRRLQKAGVGLTRIKARLGYSNKVERG